jgi:hypothetical protein
MLRAKATTLLLDDTWIRPSAVLVLIPWHGSFHRSLTDGFLRASIS